MNPNKKLKLKYSSAWINRDARKYKKEFQNTKNPETFAEWLNCQLYAPAMRIVVRSMTTKYFETKVNKRRKRILRDYCKPDMNFYKRNINSSNNSNSSIQEAK